MATPVLYTDETPMPFGKYQGIKLANVPATYLYFIYYNLKLGAPLKAYIEENHEAIKQEMNRAKKQMFR